MSSKLWLQKVAVESTEQAQHKLLEHLENALSQPAVALVSHSCVTNLTVYSGSIEFKPYW